MHLKRLVSAFILLPLLYMYVMYLPAEYFLFLITFLSVVALAEFYTICGIRGIFMYSGLFWGASLLFVFFYRPDLFLGVLLFSTVATITLRLFLTREPSGSIPAVSAAIFGLIYLPGLMSFQLSLAKSGPAWIVMLYTAVWAADSAAFYTGKSIGKRRLYPEISPNKTIAGAAGSLVGGILGAFLIKMTLLAQVSFLQAAVIGLAVGFSTILGDLAESMFKRDAGVKDSSHLVPGHGGVLDKLDGVTFAGPVFYLVCLALGLIW
jgi:phosphatidate cytidylyltransferase